MLKIDFKQFLRDYIVYGFHLEMVPDPDPRAADGWVHWDEKLVFKRKWMFTFEKYLAWSAKEFVENYNVNSLMVTHNTKGVELQAIGRGLRK